VFTVYSSRSLYRVFEKELYMRSYRRMFKILYICLPNRREAHDEREVCRNGHDCFCMTVNCVHSSPANAEDHVARVCCEHAFG
jgi:hypothetical protein